MNNFLQQGLTKYLEKTELSKIKEMEPAGIILSGGPASVYLDGAPTLSKEIYEYPL